MKIEVTKQKLRVDGVVAEGAINYATFELFCDESWQELVKTVRFATKEGVYDIPEVEVERSYYIPHEVLREGRVWVGVIGVSGDSRVATTEKASFNVKGAIESGGTPTATPDAYAKFVNDVRLHREAVEKAEKDSMKALENIRKLIDEVREISSAVTVSLKRAEDIRDEVYGMMNAVGMAFRDIRNAEERIISADSRYSSEEARRSTGERARVFGENKRASCEEQRRQRELEREMAESRRNASEQLRLLNDAQRNERLKELESKFIELENRQPEKITHICFTISAENEISIEEGTDFESITLYADTRLEENKLKGTAENGTVELVVDGKEISIPIRRPLYRVGELADSVTVSTDGSITVKRCTEKITVSGNESFVCDRGEDGSVIFITSVSGEHGLFENAMVSPLPDGCKEAFISGDYLFFCVDGNVYPNVPTFAEALKNRPVELIYPTLSQREEAEGSIQLDSPPHCIGYSGKIFAECKRDIFRTFTLISEKLQKALKEKSTDENT